MANEFIDYYALLGVPFDADNEEIRKAHKKLARTCHPDLGHPDGEEKTKRLNIARDTLLDPKERFYYNQTYARELRAKERRAAEARRAEEKAKQKEEQARQEKERRDARAQQDEETFRQMEAERQAEKAHREKRRAQVDEALRKQKEKEAQDKAKAAAFYAQALKDAEVRDRAQKEAEAKRRQDFADDIERQAKEAKAKAEQAKQDRRNSWKPHIADAIKAFVDAKTHRAAFDSGEVLYRWISIGEEEAAARVLNDLPDYLLARPEAHNLMVGLAAYCSPADYAKKMQAYGQEMVKIHIKRFAESMKPREREILRAFVQQDGKLASYVKKHVSPILYASSISDGLRKDVDQALQQKAEKKANPNGIMGFLLKKMGAPTCQR